jgi:hypothetical protein
MTVPDGHRTPKTFLDRRGLPKPEGTFSRGAFMHARLWTMAALGFFSVFPLAGAGHAADAPADGGLLASWSDGGSSGREARRRAIAALPLDRMPAGGRAAVEKALRTTTLYRHLPVETFSCDAALLDFALEHPEAIVDIWRVLGISHLTLDPAGPEQWRLADGYGTTGALRLLYHDRQGGGGRMVFHGRGAYAGPLSPKALTGTCLLLVQYRPAEAGADGQPRQAVEIDAFLDVDGMGLEIVTRSLQPLIVRSAAANLHEICVFMETLSDAAVSNPTGIARLANRLTRTDPEDRRTLVSIARAAARPAAGEMHDPEQLQTELAARWLPAEELDRVHRR